MIARSACNVARVLQHTRIYSSVSIIRDLVAVESLTLATRDKMRRLYRQTFWRKTSSWPSETRKLIRYVAPLNFNECSPLPTPRRKRGEKKESYKNVGKFNYDVVTSRTKLCEVLKIQLLTFFSSLIFSQTSTSVQKALATAPIFAATSLVRTLASVIVVFSWEPTVALAKVSHI